MAKKRCGYTGKKCSEHECMFWQQFRGQNPQTGQEEDKWECVTVMQPLLQLEIAKQQRATAGALESTRNVFKDMGDTLVSLSNKSPLRAIGE